jgi:hypothetical protein
VAQEKADSIHLQRPAIRNLGRAKVKELVLAIFDNLLPGGKTEECLAAQYGLTKASHSRFAGSHWGQAVRDGMEHPIPDLWHNLCSLLVRIPVLVEAAQHAGVWEVVSTWSDKANPRLRGLEHLQCTMCGIRKRHWRYFQAYQLSL